VLQVAASEKRTCAAKKAVRIVGAGHEFLCVRELLVVWARCLLSRANYLSLSIKVGQHQQERRRELPGRATDRKIVVFSSC
jgi:hypothetical protein